MVWLLALANFPSFLLSPAFSQSIPSSLSRSFASSPISGRAESGFRLGLGFYPTYSLGLGEWGGDLRESLDTWDALGAPMNLFLPGTYSGDLTRDGVALGGELRLEFGLPNSHVLGFAAGYSMLPKDKLRVEFKDIIPFTATLQTEGYRIPGTLYYKVPLGPVHFYLGGGADYYVPTIDYDLTVPSLGFTRGKLKTSGITYRGVLGIELFLSGNLTFFLDGVYTSGKLKNFKGTLTDGTVSGEYLLIMSEIGAGETFGIAEASDDLLDPGDRLFEMDVTGPHVAGGFRLYF